MSNYKPIILSAYSNVNAGELIDALTKLGYSRPALTKELMEHWVFDTKEDREEARNYLRKLELPAWQDKEQQSVILVNSRPPEMDYYIYRTIKDFQDHKLKNRLKDGFARGTVATKQEPSLNSKP